MYFSHKYLEKNYKRNKKSRRRKRDKNNKNVKNAKKKGKWKTISEKKWINEMSLGN